MKQNREAIIKFAVLFAIFCISIILGYFLWDKIAVPFRNPWEVTGPLTEKKYSPINDLVRFIIFLSLPPLILSAVYFFNIKKIKNICFDSKAHPKDHSDTLTIGLPSWKRNIFGVSLIVFSASIGLNIPTFHSWGKFDSFHEGESLGTAVSYISGNTPYKDFLFMHGLYQDPLRSVVAFNLFGRSIGSVRALESIVKILVFILLSVFFITIFRNQYLYSFIAIAILGWLHGNSIFFVPEAISIIPRDIVITCFLINLALLQHFIDKVDRKIFFIINFLFSFIPILAFSYSVDRGFDLFATYLIVSLILYFLFFRKSIYRTYYLISSFSGVLSALFFLGLLLRGNFFEFFKFTFLILPRYKGLMDGLVYPVREMQFLIICIFIAANTYWVSFKFIKELHSNNRKMGISIKKFIEKHLIEFCLLLLSILVFKNALNRSDWEHILYSSPLTYILFIYILIKYYFLKIFHRYSFKRIFNYLVIFLIVVSFGINIYRIHNKNLIVENFPFKIKDSEFIPDNYKATILFLKNNLNHDEEFFTMTSEASWYYFINKPCPTRFPVVWFAMPYFYQNEIVEKLKERKVKFILYENNNWANTIDGFPNDIRLPIVVNYIRKNYIFFKKIDDNKIWAIKAR